MASGESGDLSQLYDLLNTVNSELKNNPNSEEWLAIHADVKQQIAEAEKNAPAPAAPSPPPPPPQDSTPEPPKWSKEDHPAFQTGYQANASKMAAAPEQPADIKTNDWVMGKYSDGRDYKARVIQITGSRRAPMYTVRWKIDNSVDTIPASDVKPIEAPVDTKKRKADGPTAQPSTFTQNSNHGVISAAASINPDALKSKVEPMKCSDGPTRPAKKPKVLGSKNALEKSKSSWQAFQAGSKAGKKSSKNQSMFHTGDGVHAKVGVTGSGKPMQKDPSRARHTYEKNE